MDDELRDDSGVPRPLPELGRHVAWCDPRLCQPDAIGVPGGWHYAIGTGIRLTLQADAHVGAPALPTLHLIADQHGEDDTTYCLYSKAARASSRSGHKGMDLALTRPEAERLRDELTRWLELTASTRGEQ